MERDLVIGVDSSTSATKAVAFDARGREVAQGRASIPLSNPAPGWFEQAPADWWASTAGALRELCGRLDVGRLAGLAVSNQRETFAAFDARDLPLRPGMVWLDGRAHEEMRAFGESFGVERLHAITGKPLDLQPCLFRILWMRAHEPELFAATRMFADVHAYLARRLTGRWITSTASADPTGMLDIGGFDWSDEILGAARIARATLPALARPGERIGEVSAEAARATGLPEGLPVFAGGGDGQCAAAGVAALQKGRAFANLGTAAVAGFYGAAPAIDLSFRTETAVADDGYIYEMVVRSGAFLVDWLVGEIYGHAGEARRAAFAALEAQAARLPVGAQGVVALPYWQGCMSPHWDMDARGVFAGMSGSTRQAHLYRAVLEGLCLEIARCMEQAARASASALDHYAAIGGGAASDLWLQILADVSAKPVLRLTTAEASALGAAMAAAKGVGWRATLRETSGAMCGEVAARFDPQPARVARYAELRALQAELWPQISTWNRRLAEFARASGDAGAG